MRQLGTFDDFLIAKLIAFYFQVLAAHAAIEAIFRADVAVFDESTKVNVVVQMLQLHLQGTV